MPVPTDLAERLGLHLPLPEVVNGHRNGVNNDPAWDAAYHPCSEAFPAPGIPLGTVQKIEDWSETRVYPGTRRTLWIYVPPDGAANRAGREHSLRIMFCNDGAWYLSRSGPVRAVQVLDSLHHAGGFPATAAVFVMPGEPEGRVSAPIASYDATAAQRSQEYDQITPRYGEFLFGEILPLVERVARQRISPRPQDRLVCGLSSGGIAAFTAAWFHPKEATRVLSHCGSFTDIWGGHQFPSLVRRTPRKPIRVLLQSGANDADTPFGNWALANQTMAQSLAWAGYDVRFEFGTGGHNLAHGGAIFADSLRWLWRDDGVA
jgi:enterochelin esterase family protein